MPCPSTGPKIVCAGQNFLCQTKLIGILCRYQTFYARLKDDLPL